MEYMPLKRKNTNHRNKQKLKEKKKHNLKQKTFKLEIIFKSVMILILILYDISLFSFNIIFPLLLDETEAFQEILSFEKNINLNEDIFYKFLEINEQNKLIEENIKFEKVKNPIISIVMMVYNQAHCLHRCLRSIQNQSLKNIEIIIVDDCSLDNSVELIKEYQKEDPRIILLEHDANRGMIKTRTDGVRKAKGKYITSIDGDDTFIHKDILKNSLYIAEKANLDIVEFSKYTYKKGKFIEKYYFDFPGIDLNYIVYQPELKTKFISSANKNNRFNLENKQIIGKFIKNNLYKKAMRYVGKKYTEYYINFAEDTIFSISLFHLANSYYLMKEIGYLYDRGEKVKYIPKEKNIICKVVDKIKDFDKLKYIKFLVEKVGNNLKEQIFVYKELLSVNFLSYLYNIKLEKRHYEIMLKILEKFFTLEFLKKPQKDYLIELKNRVMKKKIRDNFD